MKAIYVVSRVWKHILFQKGNHIIAFDARLWKKTRNLAIKGRVAFDTVVLNQGLGYDASTGILTVPVGGIYVFDCTILAWEGLEAYTTLTVNDQFKLRNHCYSGRSNNFRSCSKMGVMKLHKGDKVWIAVFNGSADMYNTYTSFSGFKL